MRRARLWALTAQGERGGERGADHGGECDAAGRAGEGIARLGKRGRGFFFGGLAAL